MKKQQKMNNPVAKYGRMFNKAQVHKDRKKDLKKGYTKHKGSEKSPYFFVFKVDI